MNVNATLLIQVCNFFIASYLLRQFLFKPALSIINEEMASKTTLLTAINQQTQSLEIREKERQFYWHECRQFFIDHKPIIKNQELLLLKTIRTDNTPLNISDQETNQLIIEAQKTLEDKLKHVH